MLSLQKIFDRTENLNFTKEVNYTYQLGIIGKPSLIAGAENLKMYPLSIKLHHSFCNPQKIIDEIEEKISKKEIIDYFQGNVYIGKYVLQNLSVEVLEQIDGNITACVINLQLLESGENDTDFVQQTVNNEAEGLIANSQNVHSQNKFLAKSNAVINFVKQQAENIKNSMFSSVMGVIQSSEISSLPDVGRITAESVAEKIVSDIKSQSITNANDIVKSYTANINIQNLSALENQLIKDVLNQMPGRMIDAALQ